jgi:hypothetical protein
MIALTNASKSSAGMPCMLFSFYSSAWRKSTPRLVVISGKFGDKFRLTQLRVSNASKNICRIQTPRRADPY